MLQALKDAPEVVIRANPGCSHNLQVQHWPLRVGSVNSALRHHACVNAAMFQQLVVGVKCTTQQELMLQ